MAPNARAATAPPSDSSRLLEEALAVVKEQSYYLKKAMDAGNLRDVLRFSSTLIAELRTSSLSPKAYYELYLCIFQELQHLEVYFRESARSAKNPQGRRLCDLYESVQHAGNVVPRLYLLVTVGAASIRLGEMPAVDVLEDLNELCKGVQHPMRGLFLRFYLIQMCKDLLPDTSDSAAPVGNDTEAESLSLGGISGRDATFEFLYKNLIESNKLWTRLQHQGPIAERSKRENDRHDLRVLVGANLVRMSQLEAMTSQFYEEVASGKLLDLVSSSKDIMTQQYLLDCIIQVFSDECQIAALRKLLSVVAKVNSAVDFKAIYSNLMSRLEKFLLSTPQRLSPPAVLEEKSVELAAGFGQTRDPPDSDAPTSTLSVNGEDGRDLLKSDKSQSGFEKKVECESPPDDMSAARSSGLSEESSARPWQADHNAEGTPALQNTPRSEDVAEKVGEGCDPIVPPPGAVNTTQTLTEDNSSSPKAPPYLSHGVQHLAGDDSRPSGPPSPPPPQALDEKAADVVDRSNVQSNKPVSCAAYVIECLKESLMEVIQRAYDEGFGMEVLGGPAGSKSDGALLNGAKSNIAPASTGGATAARPSAPYRLDFVSLFEILFQFLSFLLAVCPKNFEQADDVYQLAYPLIIALKTSSASLASADAVAETVGDLMALPMKVSPDALVLLRLPMYSKVIGALGAKMKRKVSGVIVQSILSACHPISDAAAADQLYDILIPKETSEGGSEGISSEASTDLAGEGRRIAKLAHFLENDNSDTLFEMLINARSHFQDGPPVLLRYSLPSLVVKALKLISEVHARELEVDSIKGPKDEGLPAFGVKKIFQFVHSVSLDLVSSCPKTALRLFLWAADVSHQCNVREPGAFEAICNEFLKQSLTCYEEEMEDEKSKVESLLLMMGTVASHPWCLDHINYEGLTEKLTRHSAKLLKPADQCRCILLATHLFWDGCAPAMRDGLRVVECLQRCLKIADSSLQFSPSEVHLFIDIFEKAIYFFEAENQEIQPQFLSGLIVLCAEHISFALATLPPDSEIASRARVHFSNVLAYVRAEVATGGLDSKYSAVDLSALG